MNKKEFIMNRPFDPVDATQMQDWFEGSIKDLASTLLSVGVFSGLTATPGSSLDVFIAAGKAFDGNIVINVPSQQQVFLTAASSTNPRKDIICLKYKTTKVNNYDTTNKYGEGVNFNYSNNVLDSFEFVVVTGTPAASPVAPAVPAGTVLLAEIDVAKSATTLTAGNIIDRRTITTLNATLQSSKLYFGTSAPLDTTMLWIDTALGVAKTYRSGAWSGLDSVTWGGSKFFKQSTTPSGASAGDRWLNTSTNRILDYNGTSWIDPLKYQ